MRRHDMLFLDPRGLECARNAARSLNSRLERAELDALFQQDIPLIVSRQERPRADVVEGGISSWRMRDGVRLRARAEAPRNRVRRLVTPYEAASLLDRRSQAGEMVARLETVCGKAGLRLGIFGSLALETLTSYSYFTPRSDLDIVVEAVGRADLPLLYRAVLSLEERYERRLDVEYSFRGMGIKLKELFFGQKTVLGKGRDKVELIGVEWIMGDCGADQRNGA